jgi:DNA polymerase III subunit beta
MTTTWNISADPAALREAVAWASLAAAGNRETDAYRKAITMEWAGGKLTLSAFDGDMYATTTIPAAHAGPADLDAPPFAVHASAAKLDRLCRELPLEPVRLREDGAYLYVACGAAHWKIAILGDPGGELPRLQTPPVLGTVEAGPLQTALRAVLPSVADPKDDKRDAYQHVLLVVPDGGRVIEAWGTNSYVLTRMPCPWQPAAPGGHRIILPKAALQIVAKAVAGEVTLRADEGTVGFDFAGKSFIVRRWTGQFPDIAGYVSGLPAPYLTADVDADELAGALRRAGAVMETADQVTLLFKADGTVTVTAGDTAGDGDTAEETLFATLSWPGGEDREDVTITFNPSFLATAVTAPPGAKDIRIGYAADVRHPAGVMQQKPVRFTDARSTGVTDGEDPAPCCSVLVPIAHQHVQRRAAA